MTTLTSRLLINLVDRVSGPAKTAAGALGRLNNQSRAGAGLVAMQDRIAGATRRNNIALSRMQSRLIAATAGSFALRAALRNIIGPAVSFESAMADVAKVTDFDDAGLVQFGNELRRIAVTEIPLAVDQLAALAAAAAQSGVPEEDLADFTRLTAKAAVAWEVTGEAAGEALAKLRSALSLTNKETALFADAINHLSDNTASSAPDLVDYARRVASQGEFFGFAKEQTLAFGAAMIGAGAQSNVAATSFRNMGRALTRGASASGRAKAAYRKLGLEAGDVAKRMQADAVGTTLDVIERLGELPEHIQASVMSDLFGDEARALAPLLNNLDLLKETLGLVAEEQVYANSVGKEFERRARTTAYAWQRFKSQLNDVALSIGGTLLPALRSVMHALGPAVLGISAFAEANPRLTMALAGTTAALIGLRVGMLGLGVAGRLAYGGLLSIATAGLSIARVLRPIAVTPLVAALGAARTAMVGFAASAAVVGSGGAFKAIGASMLGMLAPVNVLKGALVALRGALMLTGVGAVVAGIAAAGTAIYLNWSGIKAMFSGIADGFVKGLGPAAKAFEPIANFAERITSAISGLVGPLQASDEAWRSFGETIGGTVAKGVNAVAAGLSRIVGLFSAAYDKAASFGRALRSAFSWGGGSDASSGGSSPPGRARGGPVTRGRSYLVGEHRPEIFTPGASGYITPRADGGGGAATQNFYVTQTLNISGINDPKALVEQVKQALQKSVEGALRGVHADARNSFGY